LYGAVLIINRRFHCSLWDVGCRPGASKLWPTGKKFVIFANMRSFFVGVLVQALSDAVTADSVQLTRTRTRVREIVSQVIMLILCLGLWPNSTDSWNLLPMFRGPREV
jgi:hypothetical protein